MAKNLINDETFEFVEGAEKTDHEALEARMDTAEDNISDLQTRMTAAEGDVDSLEGRMDTAESDIDTAEGNISNLQSRMTIAESDIDTAEGNISNLQGRMTTAESDVTEIKDSLSESTLLYYGLADVGDSIVLSEAFTHFEYIMFVDNAIGSCIVKVGEEAKPSDIANAGTSLFVNGRCGIAMQLVEKFSNTNTLYVQFNRAVISAVSATNLQILNGSRILIGDSIAENTFTRIRSIYGLQRIAANT